MMNATVSNEANLGKSMIDFMTLLWPINRSITGRGIRETLKIIQAHYLPELNIHEYPSGSKALDWVIPDEWEVNEAWLADSDGNRIADVNVNNLHLVGYSEAVDITLSLEELQSHLYSLPDQPDAIPYVTSYYKKQWGFCLSEQVRRQLTPGTYHAFIDARHFKGSLTLADWVLPGELDDEILFSTYCCHPSMANNELSGPVVATFLAQWLAQMPQRRYTYRFVFIPEMIGSATYLEHHREHLTQHVIAAFNLTCVGDNRAWSFLPARKPNTYSEQVAKHVLKHFSTSYTSYSWNDRGSDESMFSAPGIDLPMVSVMRTKYGVYPEYHTSLDTIGRVVTAEGLVGALACHKEIILALEHNCIPVTMVLGEPQLGPRGLYPQTSVKGSTLPVKDMLNLISYADGEHHLIQIAELCNCSISQLIPIVETLKLHGVLKTKPVF